MAPTNPIFTGSDYVFEREEKNGFLFMLTVDKHGREPTEATLRCFVNNGIYEFKSTSWDKNEAMDDCIEKIKSTLWEKCNGT